MVIVPPVDADIRRRMVDHQYTQSFAHVGHQVSVHMKLEIGMRSLILFKFVLEEKKRFVLMEKSKK